LVFFRRAEAPRSCKKVLCPADDIPSLAAFSEWILMQKTPSNNGFLKNFDILDQRARDFSATFHVSAQQFWHKRPAAGSNRENRDDFCTS